MMDELKPCPFCGNENVCVVGGSLTHYFVICTICSDGCGASASRRPTIHEAIEAWNRRSCECANNAVATPRKAGLREIDGLCISCWRDKAAASNKVPGGLLDDIDNLKRLYGNNLAIAPGAVQRIIAYADKARGRDAGGVDATSRPKRVQC